MKRFLAVIAMLLLPVFALAQSWPVHETTYVNDYANIIYEGKWFGPLRYALDGFLERTQETVTGDVRLRLSAGLARITGRKSKFSLYDTGLATYSEGDTFDRTSATGFMELYSLSYRTVAAVRRNNAMEALPEVESWDGDTE